MMAIRSLTVFYQNYINKTSISIMVLLLTALQIITIIPEGVGLILPGNFAPTLVRLDLAVTAYFHQPSPFSVVLTPYFHKLAN